MQCGQCREQGVTVEHVKACYAAKYAGDGRRPATVNAKSRTVEVEVTTVCQAQVSEFCVWDRFENVRVPTELAERYYAALERTEAQFANDTDVEYANEVRQEIREIAYAWTCEPCLEEQAHDRAVALAKVGTEGEQLTERAHTKVNAHLNVINRIAATTDEGGAWNPQRPWDAWASTSPKMAEAFESLVDEEMTHIDDSEDYVLTDSSWYIEDPRLTTAAMTALALHDVDEYLEAEEAHWDAFTTRVTRKRQPWEYGKDLLCPGCMEIRRACEC